MRPCLYRRWPKFPWAGRPAAIFIPSNASGSFPSVPVEGPPVTDAPYSGEAVNVFTQTLSDGNRIRRRDPVWTYRDRAGRTRREEMVNGRVTIRINDPVAGVHYVLDPEQRTGQMVPIPMGGPRPEMPSDIANSIRVRVQIPAAMVRASLNRTQPEDPTETVEEDLCARTIEGIDALGTRSTTILPAAAFHAERDNELTFERWRSEELQLDLERIRKDPRGGETVYRLTNINRSEPLPSLFEPPPDFQIEDVTGRDRVLRDAPWMQRAP